MTVGGALFRALPIEDRMPAKGPVRTVPACLTALLLGLAEVAALTCALVQPAGAQVLDERFPFLEDRVRRNRQWQQQQQQQQWPSSPSQSAPDQQQQQRQVQQYDPTRPPPAAPRRPDAPAPSVKVVVFGDSLADWLAYGLEVAFAEAPEIGILRKNRADTGLIRIETRYESYDWPQQAKEMLTAEKPDYVVMMIGLTDRRGIREVKLAPRNPSQKGPTAAQKGTPQPAQAAQQQQAAPAAPEKPAPDAEAPQDTAQNDPPAAPDPAFPGGVVHEFRTEKWGELYGKRIDEMIAALKSRGVPVFWVGLPSIRGTRPTSEMVYLNDLYRARAEKAGITYVDIWDGFVDEGGNFNQFGADFEGQTRRLRTADGVHFTQPGARKLAHYVEREIRRVMQTRATPMTAIPAEPEPEPEVKNPRQAAKPIASPVMSLTAPPQGNETLLGGGPSPSGAADSLVTRVLVRGEPVEAPPGRADDFAWPRRDVVTATGILPPDPVLPPTPPPAPAVASPGVVPGLAPRPLGVAPNAQRPPQQAQRERAPENSWWGSWGRPQQPDPRQQQQQRYNNRWDNNQPSFFGGWFGR
jgi:uncharacterized protein